MNDQEKAFQKLLENDRYSRAQASHQLFGKRRVGGLKPGGSPATAFFSAVFLGAVLAGLASMGNVSNGVIALIFLSCVGIGAYMANEQRWLTDEHARRQYAEENDQEDPLNPSLESRTTTQLEAMIEGQQALLDKRKVQGKHSEVEQAKQYLNQLQEELASRYVAP